MTMTKEVLGRFTVRSMTLDDADRIIDLINTALPNFRNSLKATGLIAATFIEGVSDYRGAGWVSPRCASYRPATIRRLARSADLYVMRIPWYHPRQTWYLLSKDRRRLPNRVMRHHLSGAVLFDPMHMESWRRWKRTVRIAMKRIKKCLPRAIRRRMRRRLSRRKPMN